MSLEVLGLISCHFCLPHNHLSWHQLKNTSPFICSLDWFHVSVFRGLDDKRHCHWINLYSYHQGTCTIQFFTSGMGRNPLSTWFWKASSCLWSLTPTEALPSNMDWHLRLSCAWKHVDWLYSWALIQKLNISTLYQALVTLKSFKAVKCIINCWAKIFSQQNHCWQWLVSWNSSDVEDHPSLL